jgi:hypothetical protein
MTTESVSAGGDPRRLLADTRARARRVRLAQRVTWLPLLVLGLVTFGAIFVYRFSDPVLSDCQTTANGQLCRGFFRAPLIYWATGLVVAYVIIAFGYLQVARARGLGSRVLPYVITGIALVALSASVTAVLLIVGDPYFPNSPPDFYQFLLRLLDPISLIGCGLLVLAWLERRLTLLVFALGYLVVVLVPIDFGWGTGWGSDWGMAPPLVIAGGLLLLGSAGFALAERWPR